MRAQANTRRGAAKTGRPPELRSDLRPRLGLHRLHRQPRGNRTSGTVDNLQLHMGKLATSLPMYQVHALCCLSHSPRNGFLDL